jgi:hypothetical protein
MGMQIRFLQWADLTIFCMRMHNFAQSCFAVFLYFILALISVFSQVKIIGTYCTVYEETESWVDVM